MKGNWQREDIINNSINIKEKVGRTKFDKRSKQVVRERKTGKQEFSASTWKDYSEWLEEQKLREEVKRKASKQKKKKKVVSIKERYYDELAHPMWLKKRTIILNRDLHHCALCGSGNNLCVHHTKYEKDKKAWEYPNSTLVTLCKACHEKVHSDKSHVLYPKYITE